MSESSRGRMAPESDSLLGLPTDHRNGLISVTAIAGLSLVTSTALFCYLTFKLLQWHRQHRRRTKLEQRSNSTSVNSTHQHGGVDLSLGLAPEHFHRRGAGPLGIRGAKDSRNQGGARPGRVQGNNGSKFSAREPNQFVVLLYNLLLADIHQAMAFFLNAVWLFRDGIEVGSRTCWAQGWFVSTGDLAASLFITAIAVHTYLVAIMGWKPSQRVIVVTCVAIWVFNYLMVGVGIAATRNGALGGGFYVRATGWCWINKEYDDIRLLTHYLFIFVSLALTSAIYILIFLRITKERLQDDSTSDSGGFGGSNPAKKGFSTAGLHGGYSWAFLTYPIIYVIFTAPLAIGRIITMTSTQVSISYFCAAGALISSNGLFDTLLWSVTRRELVFGDIDEVAGALGLETFSFMRTPQDRKYGNMVWVQGAGHAASRSGANTPKLQVATAREIAGNGSGASGGRDGLRRMSWWSSLRRFGWSGRRAGGGDDGGALDPRTRRGGGGGGRSRGAQRSVSQESLRGGTGLAGLHHGDGLGGIQMDLVTTVVIEVDPTSNGAPHGLSVSPAEYIAAMGSASGSAAGLGDDDDANGPGRGSTTSMNGGGGYSSRGSARGSEKELELNMDILNRP